MTNAMTHSVWSLREDASRLLRDDLPRDGLDVVVIGAGVAGLVTALACAREGRSIAVIERDGIGQGESLRTTAHLTSAIDDHFVELQSRFGAEGARFAAASHAEAINWIEDFVANEPGRCGFRRVPGYLFSHDGRTHDTLREEADAGREAGLDAHYLEDGIPGLPALGPAVRFADQARIDMGRYMGALARAVHSHGVQFHRGRAVDVRGGEPAVVELDDGTSLRCGAVVVATNVPFHERFAIHTKQAAYRSYVVAGPIEEGALPDALLWDDGDPYHYVRLAQDDDGGWLAIIGGEDHKTGQDHDTEAFVRLQAWAAEHVPGVREYTHGWSGQIIEPVDGLAYLGADAGGEENVFVVSGDSGEGVTHGTLGGLLIADLIARRTNPWTELYDPSRTTLRAGGQWLRENANVAVQFRDWLTRRDDSAVRDLARGEGRVVRRGIHQVAVYRNGENRLCAFNAKCPHLGCVVRWSPQEKSWDCPCHGSRFAAATGDVLNGPANHPLAPYAWSDGTE